MRDEIAARAAADRAALWQLALDVGLAAPAVLAIVPAIGRRAGELLDGVVIPALGPDFGAQLAHPASPAAQAARTEFGRMAAAAELLSTGIYALHSSAPEHASATARAAIWFVLASAVLDEKLDHGAVHPDEVRQRCNPTAVLAAATPGGASIAFPTQPLLERLLTNATTAIADRIACGTSAFDRTVAAELRACLRDAIAGQLDSPELRIDPLTSFDEVEQTLRRVNTLTAWTQGYLGLFGARELADDTLRSLRHICRRIGEIGWALDALSDIHVDLDAGVWNLVWLELARRDASWIAGHRADPDLALARLADSDVTAAILQRIALSIDEVRDAPAVDPAAARGLADFCSYMVWTFLCVEPR